MLSNILQIFEPFANCVYQRDNTGYAAIPVRGVAPVGTESVKAVFTPQEQSVITLMTGSELPIIQSIPVDKDGNFAGSVILPGGWYSLDLSTANAAGSINRVGAGEVFVVFGHSFAAGGHDTANQNPANDERVITLQDDLKAVNFQFGKLTKRVGPFHDSPDWCSKFGDLMVNKLKVPVLIYGAAYGGSNVQQNLEVIDGVHPRTSFPPGTTDDNSRQPFQPLETVLNTYVPHTGVRALLVEHGYNDRGTSTDDFAAKLTRLLAYVRDTYHKPNLSVILVQEQLTPVAGTLYDVNTANGIKKVLGSLHDTYKGPDFNSSAYDGLFAAHDHLFGPAMVQYAADWAASITPEFLSKSTPYLGDQPDVFPVVLYNAPVSQFKTLDWVLLGGAALCLVALFIYKNKYLIWAFLLLAILAGGRLTGKL